MKYMMGRKILEYVQKQNQCNSNEAKHTFDEYCLGESSEEAIIKVSSPSPVLIDLVSYSPLELAPA